MNTFQYASTSSFSEELPTPVGSANAFPNSSGWTSSTAGNELSAKRQNSSDHLGPAFKHQKTPSTSVTRNNEHVSSSDRRSLETECNRDGVEGMNENDIVHQRNISGLQDGSPESEVKRVLSVVWSKGKLGSAYYDTETSQIYLQMDVGETKDFQFLKRVKEQVQADIVITSAVQDERLLKILHGQGACIVSRFIPQFSLCVYQNTFVRSLSMLSLLKPHLDVVQ